ncbi:hypothetical protein EYF80_009386 [Liparis tanakae]|uniref:Uncharacterized protein n=1 Tax=Liparis tanakae TaxID=230148 RepID=A0A4Z2ISU2_9TELE|nr:hypothetical protein EYF80_009386 [Liparis tanakae]
METRIPARAASRSAPLRCGHQQLLRSVQPPGGHADYNDATPTGPARAHAHNSPGSQITQVEGPRSVWLHRYRCNIQREEGATSGPSNLISCTTETNTPGVGVDEVDGAGNTGAHNDLTHVPKALGQPRQRASSSLDSRAHAIQVAGGCKYLHKRKKAITGSLTILWGHSELHLKAAPLFSRSAAKSRSQCGSWECEGFNADRYFQNWEP